MQRKHKIIRKKVASGFLQISKHISGKQALFTIPFEERSKKRWIQRNNLRQVDSSQKLRASLCVFTTPVLLLPKPPLILAPKQY
jgi:3-methyladenine DNA glycosylase AlkC